MDTLPVGMVSKQGHPAVPAGSSGWGVHVHSGRRCPGDESQWPCLAGHFLSSAPTMEPRTLHCCGFDFPRRHFLCDSRDGSLCLTGPGLPTSQPVLCTLYIWVL